MDGPHLPPPERGRPLEEKLPYNDSVKRLLWLVPTVALCAGVRFHDVNVRALKPLLPSIGGPPGPGCGTGTTATWVSHLSSKKLQMSADEAVARVERDLFAVGYRRVEQSRYRAVFVRYFDGSGKVSIAVNDWPGDGACTVYCAVRAPTVTWYGMRLPSL